MEITDELTELVGEVVILPHQLYVEAGAYIIGPGKYGDHGFESKVLIVSLYDDVWYFSKINDEWYSKWDEEIKKVSEISSGEKSSLYQGMISVIFDGDRYENEGVMSR